MELIKTLTGAARAKGDSWDPTFRIFHARFAPLFYWQEGPATECPLRTRAALPERKNSGQLAAAMGELDPQGMQRLLDAACWNVEAVHDELIGFVPSGGAKAMASSPCTRRAWLEGHLLSLRAAPAQRRGSHDGDCQVRAS